VSRGDQGSCASGLIDNVFVACHRMPQYAWFAAALSFCAAGDARASGPLALTTVPKGPIHVNAIDSLIPKDKNFSSAVRLGNS
jgi:hypothetical protein